MKISILLEFAGYSIKRRELFKAYVGETEEMVEKGSNLEFYLLYLELQIMPQ